MDLRRHQHFPQHTRILENQTFKACFGKKKEVNFRENSDRMIRNVEVAAWDSGSNAGRKSEFYFSAKVAGKTWWEKAEQNGTNGKEASERRQLSK